MKLPLQEEIAIWLFTYFWGADKIPAKLINIDGTRSVLNPDWDTISSAERSRWLRLASKVIDLKPPGGNDDGI